MKAPEPMSLFKKSLLLAAILLAANPLHADLNSDLAFTAFSNVDVNAMAGGKLLQVRGGLLPFERGITSQSLFIIDATPAQVQDKLVHWNPASHSKLDVWIHQPLPLKPTVADFAGLATLPDNSSVNYQINTTAKLDPKNPALLMDKNEAQLITQLQAQKLDKKALFVAFWSQVLNGRVNYFLNGKLDVESYATGDGEIHVLGEINSLLRSDAKVYAEFHSLLVNTPVYSSTKASPAALYYDCFDVQGYGVLGTGAVFQAPKGNAIQSVDIEYFTNSSLYTTIELEKIWPITVNGKNVSLVWREDLVSTPNISYLHGVERLASNMLMLQEVQTAVEAFRSEFAKHN